MKQLQEILSDFNKTNRDDIQPINERVLLLLNELQGIRLSTAWIDEGWVSDIQKYNSDFDQLDGLRNRSIKDVEVNFGSQTVKIDSPLLLDQLRKILTENLYRKYIKTKSEKKQRGGPQSPWLRTCIQGKPLIIQLHAEGVSNDFLAHFFQVDPETFKRKIRTVIKKTI